MSWVSNLPQLLLPKLLRTAGTCSTNTRAVTTIRSNRDVDWSDSSSSDLYDLVLEMRWVLALEHCQKNPIDASYQDGDNLETPLYLACQNRPPVQLIRELLQAHPEAAETTSRHGDWPLHIACRYNASIEVIQELVKCRPDIVGRSSKWGKTAVQVLWECRDVTDHSISENYNGLFWNKMRVLLEGLAIAGQRNHVQFTDQLFLVHAAVSLGSHGCPYEVFEYALHLFPGQASMKDCQGRIPLHIACGPSKWSNLGSRKYKPREQQFISELLQRFPEGARCMDPNGPVGRYPLHTALVCRHRWEGGVKEIFQRAPEVLFIHDPVMGVLPFQLAAMPVRETAVHLDTVFEALKAQPTAIEEVRHHRWISIEEEEEEKPENVVVPRCINRKAMFDYHRMNHELYLSDLKTTLEDCCSPGFAVLVGTVGAFVVLKEILK